MKFWIKYIQQWKSNILYFPLLHFYLNVPTPKSTSWKNCYCICIPHLLDSNHVSSEFYVFTMQSQVSRTSHMNVSRLEIMFFYIAMIQVLLLCNLNGSRNTSTLITRKEILIDKLGRYSNLLVYAVFYYTVF